MEHVSNILYASIILALFFLWLKALVEIANSKFRSESKMYWFIIVLLLNFIGLILYHTDGRKMRILEDVKSKIEED